MVSGSGSLSRSFIRRVAKMARICSKRKATSRPFFSPASVITVKCVEWISSHGDGSAAGADMDRRTPKSITEKIEIEMGRMRAMRVPPGKRTTNKMLTRGVTDDFRDSERLLVAAGVVLRGNEHQARARFRGTRLLLGSSAESMQDADDCGISG